MKKIITAIAAASLLSSASLAFASGPNGSGYIVSHKCASSTGCTQLRKKNVDNDAFAVLNAKSVIGSGDRYNGSQSHNNR